MKNKNMRFDIISRPFPSFTITDKLRDNIKSYPLR